jgi:hypothetical protein
MRYIMLHARSDYNRIQDPAGLIAEDEPVFLLRAKDIYAPEAIEFWAEMVEEDEPELSKSVMNFANFMREWQNKNGCKKPNVPNDKQWSEK